MIMLPCNVYSLSVNSCQVEQCNISDQVTYLSPSLLNNSLFPSSKQSFVLPSPEAWAMFVNKINEEAGVHNGVGGGGYTQLPGRCTRLIITWPPLIYQRHLPTPASDKVKIASQVFGEKGKQVDIPLTGPFLVMIVGNSLIFNIN